MHGNGGDDIVNRINTQVMIIALLLVAFGIWWLFKSDDENFW
jgi:hypothetical protein